MVSFFTQLLRGDSTARALRFEAFMFVWILALSWIVVAVWALRRMSVQAKGAGVTLDYIADLPRSEREAFWKRHPLREGRRLPSRGK